MQVGRCWNEWVDCWRAERERLRLLSVALAAMGRLEVARGWRGIFADWCQRSAELEVKRRVLQRASRLQLARGWRSWRGAWAGRLHQLDLIARAVRNVRHNPRLLRCFSDWVDDWVRETASSAAAAAQPEPAAPLPTSSAVGTLPGPGLLEACAPTSVPMRDLIAGLIAGLIARGLEVQLPRWQLAAEGHTEYVVLVRTPDGSNTLLTRRYSAFRALHAALVDELALGAFPVWKRLRHTDAVRNQRRQQLEEWLQFVTRLAAAVWADSPPTTTPLASFLVGTLASERSPGRD